MQRIIKTLLTFSFLIIGIVSCSNESENTENIDEIAYKVKGGFTKCKLFSSVYQIGESDSISKELICLSTYDKIGNLIENKIYNKEKFNFSCLNYPKKLYENIIHSDYIDSDYLRNVNYTIKYNYIDNLIVSKIVFNSIGNIINKYICSYNYNQQKTLEIWSDSNGLIEKLHSYKYDKNSNLVEEYFNETGFRYYKINYKYDENGVLIESQKNNPLNKATYHYNNNNKLTEKREFINDKLTRYEKYFYNEKGKKVKELHYNSSGITKDSCIFLYDENSTLLEENYNFKEMISTNIKHKYQYDEKGNIIKKFTRHYYYGSDYYNTYEYDVFGNITQILKFDITFDSINKLEFIYSYGEF